MLKDLALISLGAILGANSRYLLSAFLNGSLRPLPFVPGTLVVNVLGCFLAGLFFVFAAKYEALAPYRLFIVVGFLGSFTTFSAFSTESLALLDSSLAAFFINVLLNVLASLAATALAIVLFK